MEKVTRPATEVDLPLIARCCDERPAVTINKIKGLCLWSILEQGGKVIGVHKQSSSDGVETWFPPLEVDRTPALKLIKNVIIYCKISDRKWGDNPKVWKDALEADLEIVPSRYETDPTYERVEPHLQCALLGDLYERIVRCQFALKKGEPEAVFERFGIPSHMRNIAHENNSRLTLLTTRSACTCYPIKREDDYTIFGEKVETRPPRDADLPALMRLVDRSHSPIERLHRSREWIEDVNAKVSIRNGTIAKLFSKHFSRYSPDDFWREKMANDVKEPEYRSLILGWEQKVLDAETWKQHLRRYFGIEFDENLSDYSPIEKHALLGDLFERLVHCEYLLRYSARPKSQIYLNQRLPKRLQCCEEVNGKLFLCTTLTGSWFPTQYEAKGNAQTQTNNIGRDFTLLGQDKRLGRPNPTYRDFGPIFRATDPNKSPLERLEETKQIMNGNSPPINLDKEKNTALPQELLNLERQENGYARAWAPLFQEELGVKEVEDLLRGQWPVACIPQYRVVLMRDLFQRIRNCLIEIAKDPKAATKHFDNARIPRSMRQYEIVDGKARLVESSETNDLRNQGQDFTILGEWIEGDKDGSAPA